MCSQVKSEVVYAILQELLTYSKINKPKGFDKSVMSHFFKVRVLVKQLRVAVMLNRDIWDNITIVVATDIQHKEFDHVTSELLGQRGEKIVTKIQSLLSSAIAKFLNKRAIGVMAELAHMSKNSSYKRKVTSEDKYFNCHKMGHYGKDCKYLDYRLLKKKNSSNTR